MARRLNDRARYRRILTETIPLQSCDIVFPATIASCSTETPTESSKQRSDDSQTAGTSETAWQNVLLLGMWRLHTYCWRMDGLDFALPLYIFTFCIPKSTRTPPLKNPPGPDDRGYLRVPQRKGYHLSNTCGTPRGATCTASSTKRGCYDEHHE